GTTAYNAAEGDIHHLRPSDDDVNNARWHFDFGETNCPQDGACKVSEGSELGQRPGVTGYTNCPTGNLTLSHVCVMEVRPERAGDIARGMFYMATRYGMAMDDAMEDVLREWNRADPPDPRELTRNDGAHAAQGNRNVFVDRPDLVDRIADF
ncbi:MAG TPA: endonuclease, partial [Myxococcota bacterium]|nr:endonuclease [Myxococcota bacterium]